MKVLCLNGSPRRDGSTVILMRQILAGLMVDAHDVRIWHLGDADIGYCTGCKTCHKSGHCVRQDDVDLILEDLVAAELVIVASPSYWGDVTGQMKVFFDRNTPYSDTNPSADKLAIPAGKAGVSVAVRAGMTERENLHILDSIEHYFGHLGIAPRGRLSVTGVDTVEDLHGQPDALRQAYALGEQLRVEFEEGSPC